MTPPVFPARVYSDGSCLSGAGGWAAVVEDDPDGFVVRGHEAGTTSTRMELRAAIGGLAALPAGRSVLLYFDCTAVMGVYDRWIKHELPVSHRRAGRGRMPRDTDLWVLLADQFDRLQLTLRYLADQPREHKLVHRRAHLLSREEAVHAAGGEREAQMIRDRQLARQREQEQARQNRLERRRLFGRHLPGCDPLGYCTAGCPILGGVGLSTIGERVGWTGATSK